MFKQQNPRGRGGGIFPARSGAKGVAGWWSGWRPRQKSLALAAVAVWI